MCDVSISVIVPTYNRVHMLGRTIDSLLSQDFPKNSFEIIVVDNNSSDCTKSAVENYIDKCPEISIRYVFEPRPGLVFARHTGARMASYELLAYCDDDGTYCPSWLTKLAEVYSLDNRVCAVGGKITISWDVAPPDWVIPFEHLLGKLDYGDEVLIDEGLFINGGNFSIKKSVLFRLGGFNPDQIGDWLIGDGETGLCKKMHEAGCKIGWAPKAVMEHHQIVKKNATLKDMKRRYYNNGIAIPYRLYSIERRGIRKTVSTLFKAIPQLYWYTLRFMKAKIKGDQHIEYESLFNIVFYKSQFSYVFKLILDRQFRKELLREDWF